jgi:hypothetical protein
MVGEDADHGRKKSFAGGKAIIATRLNHIG